MIHQKPFEVFCEDGVRLSGKLIIPESPKAVVQFNCGTAAKKEFYIPFLEYLAEHGYICALWDYRGSGDSAPEDLATCEYNFLDYGTKDMPAIYNYLKIRFPDLPYFLFGHSAGGQQVGFMPKLEGISGMVGVAVSVGYAPFMPWWYRLQSHFFFYIFAPLSFFFAGYLKAKPFGIMENLPKNVLKQWRAWCSKRNYFFDPKFYGKSVPTGKFKHLPFPVHVFWASDDPISNQRSTPTFWLHADSLYRLEFTRTTPKELGERNIGHFGFFKKRMRDSLWLAGLQKLDEMLEQQHISPFIYTF